MTSTKIGPCVRGALDLGMHVTEQKKASASFVVQNIVCDKRSQLHVEMCMRKDKDADPAFQNLVVYGWKWGRAKCSEA